MGRIFGTKSAREHAALYSDAVDNRPSYPDLPRSLNKLIFEQTITANERHNQWVVILGSDFVPATDVAVSKWLLKEYGDHLDSEKFQIAQMLLCSRIRYVIEGHTRLHKERTAFTYINWLHGYI